MCEALAKNTSWLRWFCCSVCGFGGWWLTWVMQGHCPGTPWTCSVLLCCPDGLSGSRQSLHVLILHLGSPYYAVCPDCGPTWVYTDVLLGLPGVCAGTAHMLALEAPGCKQRQMDRKSITSKPGALPSLSSPKALGNLYMLKIFVQNCLPLSLPVDTSHLRRWEFMGCLWLVQWL